jgi:reverse gyrase
MSLAAAVAVAGLTSTVSAKNLEDAIKGVEVSGYIDYRKEYRAQENGGSFDVNEYSVNVTTVTKVNDMVTATLSAGFDEVVLDNVDATLGTTRTSPADLDQSATVGVDQAFFTFNMGMATVMAGKQNIPSVFVDQSDTVKQGAGVVALVKAADALTVAAAHLE